MKSGGGVQEPVLSLGMPALWMEESYDTGMSGYL